MDITPQIPKDRQIINRYGNGGFIVSNENYKGNVLILPNQIISWPVLETGKITENDFNALFTSENPPEILLIGTGIKFIPIAPEIKAMFRLKNIALDGMDTGAACRTYNVLLAEDRRVAAALIAV